MDIAIILTRKFPEELWRLEGDDYSGLTWLSDTTKPTLAELEALSDEVQDEIAAEVQAKADAKASAIGKLEALGLTVDEVSAAFGIEV